jgi:hypothetical protein
MIADAHICIYMILKCSLRFCCSLPQFSVTEHFRSSESGRVQALPGVFFFYDLSPIKVTFTEQHVSFLHFLTNVCAIVGGNVPCVLFSLLTSHSLMRLFLCLLTANDSVEHLTF